MRNGALSLLALAIAACGLEPTPTDADFEQAEDALATYRVGVTTASAVVPGANADLSIRVVGPDGADVTRFDDLHTQPMHVVGVSSDLEDFVHVHPVLGSDGTLRVAVPVARTQPYHYFFEYDPAGPAGEQTSRGKLRPVGGASVTPRLDTAPAFDGSAAVSSTTAATRLELEPVAHGMLMPGMSTTLRLAVTNADGAPATDLVDWLGMPGHAIVLSEDIATFIHAHAVRPGSAGPSGGHSGHGGHGGHDSASTGTSAASTGTSAASNVLAIDLTLPEAGYYKMFVQVKRGADVVTAPFVLHATAM